MPLLMKHSDPAPLPPESCREIVHGSADDFAVERGQLLTIADVAGDRTAQLFAFTDADRDEFLSPHHTRVFSNSYRLTLGMRLVTNRRRPLMVLGRDSAGTNDLLMPGSTGASLGAVGLAEPGCAELLAGAIAASGVTVRKHPDPVNLFMNVAVEQTGRLRPTPSAPAPGRLVTFRVLIDCRVFVVAAPNDLGISDGQGALLVRVHNKL